MEQLFYFTVKLIRIYELILVIRIFLSWFDFDDRHPILQFIGRITDPLLDAARRAFPFLATGGFDLSPIVVFILLEMTQKLLIRSMMNFL